MYRDSRGKFVKQQQSPLPENLQQSNQLPHQREQVNNERDSLGENSAESLSPVSIDAPAISTDLLNELADEKLPTLVKQEPPTTPRRSTRRHEQEVLHKCPQCDYKTPYKSSIAPHMKLKHSDERPWQCDICFKSYKLKHHLKAHMESKHASAKPFPCKLCDFSCIDVRTLNKHIFNQHNGQNPPEYGQRMLNDDGAGGPMRPRDLPNMLRMNRPYDHNGFSNNPYARKNMAGAFGQLPNQLAGHNPVLTQNKMKPNQILSPLASDPVALMAQMSLQLAASMRQLQSGIHQQVQTSISSPMPAFSLLSQHAQHQQKVRDNLKAQMQPLRCEHCQIAFPDQIMYMAHMDMHKRQPYTIDDLFYQPFQCSRCSHICKDRKEFFLHWRNNECNN